MLPRQNSKLFYIDSLITTVDKSKFFQRPLKFALIRTNDGKYWPSIMQLT